MTNLGLLTTCCLGAPAYSWLLRPCLEAGSLLYHSRVYSRGLSPACYALSICHGPSEASTLLLPLSLLHELPGESHDICMPVASALRPVYFNLGVWLAAH